MKFRIIGVRWDKTQTFRKGASKAPELIKEMFPKIENFVSGIDLSEVFFNDEGYVDGETINEIWNGIYTKLYGKDGFPIIIGGDHSITFGAVKSIRPDYYVCFDAHPDMENSDGHDGVNRKIVELLGKNKVFLYGIRCLSKNENEFINSNKISINDFRVIKKLKGKIYLSIDLDVLDPSVLPEVGNPEPDGMKFGELIEMIAEIADKLVGVDFVEYTPATSTLREIHTAIAAKLIYAIIAEIAKKYKSDE